MKLDIAIEPIITDNTAFTVLTALRSLGYEELSHVERADHVVLDLEGSLGAQAVAEKVSRAEILFNPNKHRLTYASADAPSAKPVDFEALVRDKDEDNRRLAGALSTTFGIHGLLGLERAVAWHLIEKGGGATRERLEWACSALLANPVSQTHQIRPRPAYVALGGPAANASKGTR